MDEQDVRAETGAIQLLFKASFLSQICKREHLHLINVLYPLHVKRSPKQVLSVLSSKLLSSNNMTIFLWLKLFFFSALCFPYNTRWPCSKKGDTWDLAQHPESGIPSCLVWATGSSPRHLRTGWHLTACGKKRRPARRVVYRHHKNEKDEGLINLRLISAYEKLRNKLLNSNLIAWLQQCLASCKYSREVSMEEWTHLGKQDGKYFLKINGKTTNKGPWLRSINITWI